jgi:hypothetical protein
VPTNGACFFKDVDFRGTYFCVNAGDETGAMPLGMNDEISSIRVFGRVQVMIYRDEDFRGTSAELDGNVRNLTEGGWNDTISSIRVRGLGFGGRLGGGGRNGNNAGNGGRFGGGRQQPRQGACFYKDAEFEGERFCLARGEAFESMPLGFNDVVSSIQIFGGVSVMIFENEGFGGQSIRVSTDVSNLAGARSPNGFVWNDRISSLRVF